MISSSSSRSRLHCGLFLLVSCACTTRPEAVEIAAPLASAKPQRPVVGELALPEGAMHIDAQGNGAWAASFPQAKTFATVDVLAARALLTWIVGPPHLGKVFVSLEVRARGIVKRIDLGDLHGALDAHELSWCWRRGFHRPIPGREWTPPAAVASVLGLGSTQNDDQLMVVRDGATLHVLHRETPEGRCDDANQHPLDVCEGLHWSRAAAIRLDQTTMLYETVLVDGKPFDCAPTEH